MPLLSAPFYGSISRMSVNPQDNSLWMITKHPMGRSISPVRLNVQGLIETHKVNDHTQSFDIDGVAVDVLGHQTGTYVVVNKDGNGEVHRFDGTAFVPVYTCDGSFGLQILPNVWHQPAYPLNNNSTFKNKQCSVHGCVSVDTVDEFNTLLKVKLNP